MNSDQRLTLFVALLAGLALGGAIAGGMRRNRYLGSHGKQKLHEREVV